MKTIVSFTAIAILLGTLSVALSASPGQIIFPQDQLQSSLENELQDGRWELVMFWATYCGLCKKEFKKILIYYGMDSLVGYLFNKKITENPLLKKRLFLIAILKV